MPSRNTDRLEDMARACGCGPAMNEKVAACCGVPAAKRPGSQEQEEELTTEEGGA
jgi:hypothetical protein